LLSILATGAVSMRGAAAAAPAREVPQFTSGGYQFAIVQPQQRMPSLRLFRLEGGTLDLTSLRGRPILLNFWASWCAACRSELPVLDQLARGPWRGRLQVLAVSADRGDRRTVARFVDALGITALPIFLDPHGYAAYSDRGNLRKAPFALYGMPITYAITASGLILGYMPGAADWSVPSATRLIEYLFDT
jgi:thiol-disulfide isomerase/thioredoxin